MDQNLGQMSGELNFLANEVREWRNEIMELKERFDK